MGKRKCNPSPKPSVSQWEKQFEEALGLYMICHPPTEANLKLNFFLQGMDSSSVGFLFLFLLDKIEQNAPRKYSERNNKNCILVF